VDLLILGAMSIVVGIIIVCMGLSFLSQSLDSLSYNTSNNRWGVNAIDYYANPLYRLQSKWFYYRPKGAVILSQKEWEDIEGNIGVKISDAKDSGKILGYNAAIIEIQDKVREEQTRIVPASPYDVLNVASTMPINDIENNYKDLLSKYDPKYFTNLDKAFVELAEIRTDQIEKAWKQIKLGMFK